MKSVLAVALVLAYFLFGTQTAFSPPCSAEAKTAASFRQSNRESSWMKTLVRAYRDCKGNAPPPPVKFRTKREEKRWLDERYQHAAPGLIEGAALAYYSGLHFDADEAVARLRQTVDLLASGKGPPFDFETDPLDSLPYVLKDLYARTGVKSALRMLVEIRLDTAPGESLTEVRFPMFLDNPAIFVDALSDTGHHWVRKSARSFTDELIFLLPYDKSLMKKARYWLKHYASASTASEKFLRRYFDFVLIQAGHIKKAAG